MERAIKKIPTVMDEFTLIDNIEKISKENMMGVFDRCIRLLRGFLRGTTYALDSTIIVTKPDFPGCGKTSRKKEDHPNDPPESIYGFKLFVLYEVKSRIIVAIDIVPANESDNNHFLPMIKKGIRNCGQDKIKLVVADRGFLNGAAMWELKYKLGIDFIIPAKAGMIVRQDAIKLRASYEKEGKPLAEWKYGKGKCAGYGVNSLLSYLQYNPPGTKDNNKTNGTPINAVVVTMWREQSIEPGEEKVLLTSLPAEECADVVAKGYRQRSLIENSGFRELKQAAFLNNLPRRKGEKAENAAYLHMILCALAHTLFYAFISWRKKDIPKQSEDDCLRAWRRKESTVENQKIFVVSHDGMYYALFNLDEILDILGVKQKHKIVMRC